MQPLKSSAKRTFSVLASPFTVQNLSTFVRATDANGFSYARVARKFAKNLVLFACFRKLSDQDSEVSLSTYLVLISRKNC